ncbi:GRIP1-associated protein 1-like [Liolophura sinensis]|uniref:GRIP1-associated protein 1-like n=1 Tax=Liolophura sinensis TaxID=3198878 RepID=UPI00315973A0
MASGLSEEEFHRMQLQLLELRTANYELEGKQKQKERDLLSWKEKSEALEKDLQKAQKAINKSKKIKEVELLLQENDTLQLKLQSQDEDFRLQNQALMEQLSLLVTKNEELEKENSSIKEGTPIQSPLRGDVSILQDEIRRLKAENAALQKNLTSHQEKYEKELSNLRERIQHIKGNTCDQDHQFITHDDMTEDADITSSAGFDETQHQNQADESNGNSSKSIKTVEDYLREISDLSLSLDTELEEKKLLKKQLSELGNREKGEAVTLKEEVDKLTEKLRKKQESLVQLQEEKEQQYNDNCKKLEELQAARDRDQKHYTDQISKLKQELDKISESYKELESSSCQKIQELQDTLESVKAQATAASAETNQQLVEENRRLSEELTARSQELAVISHQKEDLVTQLAECQNASQTSMEQLYAVQKDRDSQIQALQEANKVAEKRKTLLDDLAIRYQKDADVHREKIQQMEEEFEAEITTLSQQLEQEKERSGELERCQRLLEEVKVQLQSVEETKGWLERRLAETEENLEKLKVDHAETVHSLQEQHQSELQEMRTAHEVLIQEHERVEEELKSEVKSKQESVEKLKQEIKDSVDEKKIHEKKGVTMLKDLKRQLHAERKRAEKLQERLQEVLSESRNKGMEELFNQSDLSLSDPLQGDGSSISSWSAGASGAGKDTSSGPQSDRTHSPQTELEEEHNDVLQRIAQLQQEKWDLEEKVCHLETSNAAMCDDLLQKTAIIEHYVMDGRSDRHRPTGPPEQKLSLKKVLDIVNKGDENAKEMNRKLQRMLEETLTKNMHLQKDLELLSEEVVRLSKVQAGASSNGGSDRMDPCDPCSGNTDVANPAEAMQGAEGL